jgi:prepilin signal peptidase PulO-like enzyme (type II secretory pathway)
MAGEEVLVQSAWTLDLLNLAIALYAGLVLGGFATVLVPRLARLDPSVGVRGHLAALSSPASSCDGCGRPLAWPEKIPALGWLWAGGRCRRCGDAVPALYPAAEIAIAAAVLAIAWDERSAPPLAFLRDGLLPALGALLGGALALVRPRIGQTLLVAVAALGLLHNPASVAPVIAVATPPALLPAGRFRNPEGLSSAAMLTAAAAPWTAPATALTLGISCLACAALLRTAESHQN